jgi:hypothetical protein
MTIVKVPRNGTGKRPQRVYAVQYAGGLVKIGQTTKTLNRRKHALRKVGHIVREYEWPMEEYFVDLRQLEKACLDRMPMAPCIGREWFHVDFDEACAVVEDVLRENDL